MIEKLKTLIYELTRQMPLDDFKDYDDYWSKRGFNAPSLHRAELISKRIQPRSRVLDIGCGDGTVIDYLYQNCNVEEIIGIDISEVSVAHVRSRGYRAYQIDIRSDQFEDFLKNKIFDYIVITEVLEHIQDPEKIVDTIKDSFRKTVFVSIPNSGFFIHRLRLLFGKFPVVVIQHHVKEHVRFWTLKDFVFWSGQHGFKIVDYVVSGGLYYKPLSFLEKIFPSLFANQILYTLISDSSRSDTSALKTAQNIADR